MERLETALPEVCLIRPRVVTDPRGFFLESYNRQTMAQLGVHHVFVQDNHSRSGRGVLRGLHYQLGQPQAKLVRATVGRVFDVVVDVRRGSPTFGRWTAHELSADNKLMLFAPEGFAHGFLVLSEVAEFQYKCSDLYAPAEERTVAWDDPELAIPWPVEGFELTLSDKDRRARRLAEMPQGELPAYPGLGAGGGG